MRSAKKPFNHTRYKFPGIYYKELFSALLYDPGMERPISYLAFYW